LHTKKRKSKDSKELCPVCDFDLYLDSEFSRKIGLIDKHKHITGWMCPKCNSEFDSSSKIVYIYGEDYVRGEA
tara:strand:- start:744 stop:962 length:219 start_codon:yes stop_codon:yes gene_type:complete